MPARSTSRALARDRVLLVVDATEWAALANQRYREIDGDAPKLIGSAPVFQQTVQQAERVASTSRSDVG